MNRFTAAGTISKRPDVLFDAETAIFATFVVSVPREDGSGITDCIVCRSDHNGLVKYIHDYLQAGTPVTVEGELQTEAYWDDNGRPCICSVIAVSHVRRLRTEDVLPYNGCVALPGSVPDDPGDMWEDDEAQLPF